MSYQRFNKSGRVAKSPFLAKSVQKSLNKKIETDFFQKTTFFESKHHFQIQFSIKKFLKKNIFF